MDELEMIKNGMIPDVPIIEVVDDDGFFVKHLMLSDILTVQKAKEGINNNNKYEQEN